MKRSSFDATVSSETDPGMKRRRIGGSLSPSPSPEHNSCEGVKAEPETSLTLSPPGENVVKAPAVDKMEDARHETGITRCTAEMGYTCLLKTIQRIIKEEVRNYFFGLRPEDGLWLRPQPDTVTQDNT